MATQNAEQSPITQGLKATQNALSLTWQVRALNLEDLLRAASWLKSPHGVFLGSVLTQRESPQLQHGAPGDKLKIAPPGDSIYIQAESDLWSIAAPIGQRPQLPCGLESKGNQELLQFSSQETLFSLGGRTCHILTSIFLAAAASVIPGLSDGNVHQYVRSNVRSMCISCMVL